jgi:two-component system NtrC family response regulator
MTRPVEEAHWDFGELNVLVVDDQEDVRRGLARLIGSLGCQTAAVPSGEAALRALGREGFDMVFTDLKMEGISGDELLQEIKRRWPDIEVVLITGYGTIDLAVACLQNGAAHFITKPFDNQDILSFVKRTGYKMLSRRQIQGDLARYRSHAIIAADPRMREVLDLVNQVAPLNVPVLIEGASGTGKELIAHEIHSRSPMRDKPFLAINCIALPDSLLESELFGYKRGAFTGAHKDTKGLFEQVAGGTVFLDEVASMSLSFQGKLLRVLQEKVVRPLGGSVDVPVEYRLIAATNRDLEEMVARQAFREDLFYRLQVVKIALPSLNERPESIPALAEYFLKRAETELSASGSVHLELSPAALDGLLSHEWKGNVRELENTIYRAVILCKGDRILPSHLGFTNGDQTPYKLDINGVTTYEEGKQKAIESFQLQFVQTVLKRTQGNISKAAELAGLTRAAFQRIMRKLDLDRDDY